MDKLEVGYASVDITPPLGIEMAGYGPYLNRRAKSRHDELFVRAAVINAGGERLALVSCEIIGLGVEDSSELCRMAGRRYGIPADSILLACIHTHSGPATQPVRCWGEPDPKYMQQLKRAIIDCIGEAVGDLSPAEFGFARADVDPIGHNRASGENGSVDPSLSVAYFQFQRGGGIVAVNHACHPVVLGINDAISADYPGEIVRRLEQEGVSGLFFNGCCGDIDPLTNKVKWGSGTFQDTACFGRKLADASLALLNKMHLTDWLDVKAAKKVIALPLQPADPDQLLAHQRECTAKLQADASDRWARFELDWVTDLLKAIESNTVEREVPFVVQALKIGDATLIGLSGEVFCEIGLHIAQRLGTRTMVVGYANGVTGYIPMPSDFDNKGYASTLAPRIYGRLQMTPNVAAIVTDAAVELAENL